MLFFPGVIYELIELSMRLIKFQNSIIRLNDLIALSQQNVLFQTNRVSFSYFKTAR